MKVILLKDVPRIGRKFDMKDVPDGHALNFLLPRRLAERATGDALKRLEAQKAKNAVALSESENAFKAAIKKAVDANVEITAEANTEGNLYRAVHADDIVKAFNEKGITIEEDAVLIETPIKTLGAHVIKLASASNEGDCTITVVRA